MNQQPQRPWFERQSTSTQKAAAPLPAPDGPEIAVETMAAAVSHPTIPSSSSQLSQDWRPPLLPPFSPFSLGRRLAADASPSMQSQESWGVSSSSSAPWISHSGTQPTSPSGSQRDLKREKEPSQQGVGKDIGNAPVPEGSAYMHPSRNAHPVSSLPRSLNTDSNITNVSFSAQSPPANFANTVISRSSIGITSVQEAYNVPAEPSSEKVMPDSRWKLHIRQQPRAARAGPDGKDRRTIDPPPVLQLLIDDFDVEKDLHFLKAGDWVVHASLVSAEPPHEDLTTQPVYGEASEDKKVLRLLLGNYVASPTFCADDPHPESAPKHPVTKQSPPPSPTMRFIKTSKTDKDPMAYKKYPGTFFIFADMSIRKAGQYRLFFRLMKMEEPVKRGTGAVVPAISTAMSDIFNVVNAKDFDQVQPSTKLIRGLVERGAGYPLKLKKGFREGQRRRIRAGESDDDDDDDEGSQRRDEDP